MDLSLQHLICFVLLNLVMILTGYWLVRHRMIAQSWVILAVSILIIQGIFFHDHPAIRMLALIATAFTAMKVLATAEAYEGRPFNLSFGQWCVFTLGWAGMSAQPFERLGRPALPNAWPKIATGISRIIAGLLLIFLAHQVLYLPVDRNIRHFIISAMLLVSFSLVLHFGLLAIGVGIWRLCGVDIDYLFKAPLKAKSVSEFWSKRWNLAFSEMTSVVVYRPLMAKVRPAPALMTAFIFSGLLHELAISAPVKQGYGLPLIYFIIQGFVVLLEKKLSSDKPPFLQHRVFARLWVFFWLVVPLPLLFTPHFINEIVWPIAGLSSM